MVVALWRTEILLLWPCLMATKNPYKRRVGIFFSKASLELQPFRDFKIGEDFLPGSVKIPPKEFIPKPKGTDPEKYAWEED